MINETRKINFLDFGQELDRKVRLAFEIASTAVKDAYGVHHIGLEEVTTKAHLILSFSKYVEWGVLKTSNCFDEEYIVNIFNMYRQKNYNYARRDINRFLAGCNLEYKKTFGSYMKRGFGLFLLSLHVQRAIVLPMGFNWPTSRASMNSNRSGQIVCASSELLYFFRSVDTSQNRLSQIDAAFGVLDDAQKRLEWFSTYATKIALATGWHTPEEINLADLLTLHKAQQGGNSEMRAVSGFGEFARVLLEKYRGRVNYDENGISAVLGKIRAFGSVGAIQTKAKNSYGLVENESDKIAQKKSPRSGNGGFTGVPMGAPVGMELDSSQHFKRLLNCPPSMAYIKRLPAALTTASGDFPFQQNLNYWIELEQAYVRSHKRESYKMLHIALGLWNMYLCWYLPYWYLENPNFSVPFPSTPNELHPAVFVSRLLHLDGIVPLTFMEFMNARSEAAGVSSSTLYGYLIQIESFFAWISKNTHRLRDCAEFIQPMSRDDFPRTPRNFGTNKVPIPRRFFAAFVAYFNVLVEYCENICDLRLGGRIHDDDMLRLRDLSVDGMLDTFSCAPIVGYIPIFYSKEGKVFPIRKIPALPHISGRSFKNGRSGLILHPHVVNHLQVAVITGLRHNHIQWLDADTFDCKVEFDAIEYTQLFVNTDKVKNAPWTAETNMAVIEVLRLQLKWRNSVDCPGFVNKVFYNDNPQTKYAPFRPLFSYYADGRPHSDDAYASYWKSAIECYQELLPQLAGKNAKIPQLGKRVEIKVEDVVENLRPRRRDSSTTKIRTTFVTPITPHSSRVSVISEYYRFLPARYIGKYITGQSSEATVFHYIKLDADDMAQAQAYQNTYMRDVAATQQAARIIGKDKIKSPHIQVDGVNSRLARNTNVNASETIARYGCISLSLYRGETGVDILRRDGDSQAAYNKTEICPFGNVCPDNIVQLLRGWRRCSLCPVAVRSIDHLPAICAKQKQVAETMLGVDAKIENAIKAKIYSDDDLDALEDHLRTVAEDLVGWELCIDVLHRTRMRIESGEHDRKWIVEQPEILARGLQRVQSTTADSAYLLARLDECTSYNGFDSPEISTRFQKMTRVLLAREGRSLEEILAYDPAIDAASECAGLMRSLASTHNLTVDDVTRILTTDSHLIGMAPREMMRFADEG